MLSPRALAHPPPPHTHPPPKPAPSAHQPSPPRCPCRRCLTRHGGGAPRHRPHPEHRLGLVGDEQRLLHTDAAGPQVGAQLAQQLLAGEGGVGVRWGKVKWSEWRNGSRLSRRGLVLPSCAVLCCAVGQHASGAPPPAPGEPQAPSFQPAPAYPPTSLACVRARILSTALARPRVRALAKPYPPSSPPSSPTLKPHPQAPPQAPQPPASARCPPRPLPAAGRTCSSM